MANAIACSMTGEISRVLRTIMGGRLGILKAGILKGFVVEGKEGEDLRAWGIISGSSLLNS